MQNEYSNDQIDIMDLLGEANLAYEQKNMARAEELYLSVLRYFDEHNLSESAEVAVCLQNLVDIYTASDQYGAAIPLLRRLVALGEKVLGVHHQDVVATMFKLAIAYDSHKMFNEAEEMFKRAASSAERALGIAHPISQQIREAYFAAMSNRAPVDEFVLDGLSKPELPPPYTGPRRRVAEDTIDSPVNWDSKVDAIKLNTTNTPRRPKQKISNYRRPTKIKHLRYGAESAEEQANKKVDLKKIEHHWQNYVFPTLIILGLLVFTGFVLSNLKGEQSIEIKAAITKQLIGHKKFSSVDGLIGMTFVDRNYVILDNDLQHRKIPYSVLKGGIDDILAILQSAIIRREMWYQSTNDYLTTESGNILYSQDAPEQLIGTKMRLLQEFAQRYYGREGCYPNDAKKWESVPGLVYTNPFNNTPETPLLKKLNGTLTKDFLFPGIGNSDTQTIPADFLRNGGSWREEAAQTPGRINCLCLYTAQRCADGFKITDFYIRGYGRKGDRLTAGKPNNYYVIALKNGKLLSDDTVEHSYLVEQYSEHPPDRVCIVADDSTNLSFLHNFVLSALGLIIGISFFTWLFLEFRKRVEQPQRLPQPNEVILGFSLLLFIVVSIIHILP